MSGATEPIVRIAWAYGDDRELADRLLLDLVGGGATSPGQIRRLCPWCGSGAHGRPVLPGHAHPHLSVARAGALTMVATCDLASIGVDVERTDAVAEPGGVLHPCEGSTDAAGRTITWVRKEALLKATGHGLRIDPTTVRLSAPDAPAELLEWPESPTPASWLCDVPTAPGYVAALAVMARGPVRVLVSQAAQAGPPSTATR